MDTPTLAVTININPASYVSIPIGGKMVRKKWQKHDNADQVFFLSTFFNYLRRYGISDERMTHRYELTDKKNMHLHIQVTGRREEVERAKQDLCATVCKTMPANYKDRLVYIKIADSSGWLEYVLKGDEPESEEDERIEIPKHNIMRRHLK